MNLAKSNRFRQNGTMINRSCLLLLLTAVLTAFCGVQAHVVQPDACPVAPYPAEVVSFSDPSDQISPFQIETPTISEWSSGWLFLGGFQVGYGGAKRAVPGFGIVWIGCQSNPVNAIDYDGRETFKLNRQLNPDNLPTRNPVEHYLSHTFVYTTNPNGSLKDTYSWGNEYAKNSKAESVGLWFKNRPEDRSAALEAIWQKQVYESVPWSYKFFVPDNFGIKVGTAALDPYIEQEFLIRSQYSLDDPRMHEWELLDNCKNEADKLVLDAYRFFCFVNMGLSIP